MRSTQLLSCLLILIKERGVDKVYVSGPMTGLPNYNFDEFNRVAELLRNEGYNVVNPAVHGVIPEWEWKDYLKLDIKDMLGCDIVATLEGWEESRGARLEVYIAEQLHMKVVPFEQLLKNQGG